MRAAGALAALLHWLPWRGDGAPRMREEDVNLWVCPHCEGGVKSAEVVDLGCETGSFHGGPDWPWVKSALRRFLLDLRYPLRDKKGDPNEVRRLVELASAPITGDCYLGVVALGFFSLHFMDAEERLNFFQTTVFGGVAFKAAVPLSYWDVFESGRPIFGLLAGAAAVVQHDISEHSGLDGSRHPGAGPTGIDLGPRDCCDFPGDAITEADQRFLTAVTDNVNKLGLEPLPLHLSLGYLAESAHLRCSWGRASAYLASADAILAPEGLLSSAAWNSTKALVFLGQHNLDDCETNITIYHQMQSIWPFWQILARMERRALSIGYLQASAASTGELYSSPPAIPSSVSLKWQHLLRGRDLDHESKQSKQSELESSPAGDKDSLRCLRHAPGLAHIAFSADLGQIDGLIVALNSATVNAKANAHRLCFHVFVLEHQHDFVVDALKCSFGDSISQRRARAGASGPSAFRLHGVAHLLLHDLDPRRVWHEVGIASSEGDVPDMASLNMGGRDLGEAFNSDTGNLFVAHNFVRFVLHLLLPALPRVVYLDVDIVVRGDLCALYDTPLLTSNGSLATIAAVQRLNQPLRLYVDVLLPAIPAWLPSEAPSFNAGVLVIDLVRWRERNAVRLIAEWVAMNTRRRIWVHGSQPPLLLLFHDEVRPLDWTWNIDGLGHRLNYPKDVLRQANILHWTGPLKPWRHHGVNRKLWEPYALEYCPRFSSREHTTTCRPDSWFC